jgi:phosphatidylglycerophosphatase GEP4
MENGKSFLFQRNQSLVLPHFQVASLSQIDWMALKQAGFKGCVFDKDNTLTVPYALEIHPEVQEALRQCRIAFGDNVVLYSNSAGLTQYDPAGDEALMLEKSLGIQVLRHKDKKPAGGPEDLQRHFRYAFVIMLSIRTSLRSTIALYLYKILYM